MKLEVISGLPYITVTLLHRGKLILLEKVLIDTGSAANLIPAEVAIKLDLLPEPNDRIWRVRGIGGTEFVYEKLIEKISICTSTVKNMKIQVGAMDYGLGIDALLGMDFLIASKAIIDLEKFTLTFGY